MKRGLLRCNVLQSACLDFCATYLFQALSSIFASSLDEIFIARRLIYVHKLFKCRVSFVMLFSMWFVILEKEL